MVEATAGAVADLLCGIIGFFTGVGVTKTVECFIDKRTERLDDNRAT